MNKRLAAILLSSSLLWAGFFTLPAWTQQSTPPQAQVQVPVTALPEKFDLRSVDGVTPIKKQQGGTCWTHGTMAAIESHLLVSGRWKELKMPGIPMLSEYHLDWWNGFNQKYNEDLPEPDGKTGLKPHQGGDYRVACAYIGRGDGVVIIPGDEANPPDPKKWYKEENKPPRTDPSFKRLYVRDIEWFTVGDNLEGIDLIKQRIMKYGAMGTCYAAGGKLPKELIHYQPASSPKDPNHSVAIVGWDDTKISVEDDKKAPKPGAWLIKNSWGTENKSTIAGYGWISYYDKHCGRHPEMGAVSFRNVEPLQYTQIYYHDAHGWRDTLPQVSKAFNAFTAKGRESFKAVSFFTAQHKVDYTLKVYSKFEDGKLSGELLSQKGAIEFSGFHTVDLRAPVALKENDKFYIYVELSAGGHAIDRTSKIPVLLGAEPQQKGKGGPIVLSKANAGESFYLDGTEWKDLYNYKFNNPDWATFDQTANFCMKALCISAP
jgi:hypothetical protein